MTQYPIQKLSFSCLRTFYTNPGEFKDRYILNDYRFQMSPAMLVGKMAHKVLELYLTWTYLEKAVEHAQNYLETVKDSEVKWWKTGSREKILQDFTKAVKNYFEEMPDYTQIVSVEQEMFSEIKDTIDGKNISSPIPFHGFTDLVYRNAEKEMIVEDYKFVSAFNDSEVENPQYIFQAMFYYYLAKATYNESPKQCTFREIKISTNKDGTSQHNLIIVPYSGEKFEENKVYFWYNVSSMLKQIENADENTIFLYNIFDSLNGVENFRRQKETVFGYQRDEVKASEFSEVAERGQKEVKFLENKEASTIEDKIRVKFQDYGVALKFASVERGFSYDRYLYEPGRGVKMAKIVSLNDEIKQALESKQIRIEAPVPGTKFVGVEVPRKDRVFLPLARQELLGWKIPLGKGIDGVTRYLDITNSNTPHVLAVGQTGSGKSEFLKICVEALKDTCELILIDPKRTELIGYKDLAVWYGFNEETIMEQLASLYQEMMSRYNVLSSAGTKDIELYNQKSKKPMKRKVIVFEEYAQPRLGRFGKEIEHSLLQIAALGRAAGFHVILSTQRPDVKVVSGGLKANIGTRVCFAVASQIDSKVALDEIGAENLVGMGDMLYKNPGQEIERLQSFYLANS